MRSPRDSVLPCQTVFSGPATTTMKERAMPTDRERLSGVYLLTPDAVGSEFDRVLAVVDEALSAGVRVVQYRNKKADTRERERQARALVRLVQSAEALAIVNDR